MAAPLGAVSIPTCSRRPATSVSTSESTSTIADPGCRICGPIARLKLIDLNREPELYVGGDGSTNNNNNGAAFPSIPLGGAIFRPSAAFGSGFFSPFFTGNFFQALRALLGQGRRQQHHGVLDR